MTEQPLQNTGSLENAQSTPEILLLSWVSFPAKKRPVITVILSVFLIFLIVLVNIMTESAFFTIIAAAILWGSLSQYYIPTNFSFTDTGIRVKYVINKIEKAWSQYRSYYPDKNGVLLSPFTRPSRLENFRGIYIRFDDNRDQVLEIVKQKIRMDPK